MINQQQIPDYIEEAIPAIAYEAQNNKHRHAYDEINMLTSFTLKNIELHDYKVVRNCFDVAAKLYQKGNNMVKNAVQNVFVYSFTKMFETYAAEKKQLQEMIPNELYTLYKSQLYHRGC